MQDFIEYLEELAHLRRSCSIKFTGGNGGIAFIQTRLKDVYPGKEEGYIETSDGLKISISRLIEVNGRQAQNFC